MIRDQPSLLWSFRSRDNHVIECCARLVPTGIQVEIVSDASLLYSQIFATSEEALAWAEEERNERETSTF